MSLLFNMLSGLVIAFLSRSKHLLISWLTQASPDEDIFTKKQNLYHLSELPVHCSLVSARKRWHILEFKGRAT